MNDFNPTNPACIKEYKTNEESDFSQMLLLDEAALIIESCDSLFDTTNLRLTTVLEWSPFMESMFSYFISLKPGTPEVLFSKVETLVPELQGVYDFTFACINIHGKKYLLWTIYDYTTLYKELQRNQQRMHELEIQRQSLNNRIYQILNKNINLRTKTTAGNFSSSLLFQANNILLKNIFTDLEKISSVFKNKISLDILQTFEMNLLFQELKHSIYKNSNISVDCKVEWPFPKTIIGDFYNLKYILYDLLTIQNQQTSSSPSLSVTSAKGNNKDCHLSFKVETPLLSLSENQKTALNNEFSLDKLDENLLRLKIIQKLIMLQNGFVQSIISKNNRTTILFQLTYRVEEN